MLRSPDISRRQATTLLSVLVLSAATIRLLRAGAGLPYTGQFDEPLVVNTGLRILETGSYEPFTFLYGSLAIYLSALCSAVAFLWATSHGLVPDLDTWVSREHEMNVAVAGATFAAGGWAATRALFGLIGLLSVIAVYRIARALGASRGASVIGAALVALHPLHVLAGASATVDGPAAAFMAVALALAAVGVERPSPRLRRVAALAGGVSLAFKPAVAPMLVALWLMPWVSRRGGSIGQRLAGVGSAIAISALTFLALEPFLLISPDAFLRSFGAGLFRYGALGHPGQDFTPGLAGVGRLASTLGTSPWLAGTLILLSGLGLWGSRRRWPAAVVMVTGVAAYAFVVSRQRVYFDRVALVLLVPMLAFCSVGLTIIHRLAIARLGAGHGARVAIRVAVVGVVALLFVGQWRAARAAAAFIDTRILAEDWVFTHLRPGQSVAAVTQIAWAPTRPQARSIVVYQVDPWVEPCWSRRIRATHFLTDIPPSSSDSPALASWPGRPISAVAPFLSPALYLFDAAAMPAAGCDEPGEVSHAPFPMARAGQGLREATGGDGLPTFELGFDGWFVSQALPNGGAVGLSMAAVILPVDRSVGPAGSVRVILRATVDDQDICVSRVPLPRRDPIAFTCPAVGRRAVRFHLSHNIEEPKRQGPRGLVLSGVTVTRPTADEPFEFESLSADYADNSGASDTALAVNGFRMLSVNGSVTLRTTSAVSGRPRVVLSLGGMDADGVSPIATVTVRGAASGQTLATRRVVAIPGPHDYAIPVTMVLEEPLVVTIRFENDFFSPGKGDRNLMIYAVSLRR